MALLEEELKIAKVQDILKMKLALPAYQRPYNWSVQAANTLFQDTYNAFQKKVHEYRIGSVILHKEHDNYNIVDGQQRLTTLSILLYCLDANIQGALLQEKYNQLSNDVIVTNFNMLSNRANGLSEEKGQYKNYLLHQCSVVQIITDNEQEAFQFFDSQNSRGKELAPHDLLKSYHLREMEEEAEDQKIKVISQWENVDQDYLSELFSSYLYPLTKWYKKKNGLGYSVNKIDVFKGIKTANVSNFALYHKASHLFTEQFNASGNNELLASKALNQFQLTQPLIAGKRFFHYTLHYEKQLEEIRNLIKSNYTNEEIPSRRSGDRYIKQLFECTLLFYADRFGIKNVTQSVMQLFYLWSYSLRLVMHAVYPQTINKYAQGQHERINEGLDLFAQISDMNHAEDIQLIVLEKPDILNTNKEKYDAICEALYKGGGK